MISPSAAPRMCGSMVSSNGLPLSRGHRTRKSSTCRDDDAVAAGCNWPSWAVTISHVPLTEIRVWLAHQSEQETRAHGVAD